MLCSNCTYWSVLIPGDFDYDLLLSGQKGKCSLCPPTPTGDFRFDLSAWALTLATDGCAMCRCRGCGQSPTPPPPAKGSFLLLETTDISYLLIENSGRIELE